MQEACTNCIAMHCYLHPLAPPARTKYKVEQAPQLQGPLAHLVNLNMFHMYHQIPQQPPLVLPSSYDSL